MVTFGPWLTIWDTNVKLQAQSKYESVIRENITANYKFAFKHSALNPAESLAWFLWKSPQTFLLRFQRGVPEWVSLSFSVSYPCVCAVVLVCVTSKPVCPVRACWTNFNKTQSMRHADRYTQCPPVIQCYTLGAHTPPSQAFWSLLVLVQQEKPDEASPQTRCTMQSVCPLSVFLSCALWRGFQWTRNLSASFPSHMQKAFAFGKWG